MYTVMTVSAGPDEALVWLTRRLEDKDKVKTQVPDSTFIRMSATCYEIEADPRHRELVAESHCGANDKGAATPGIGSEQQDGGADDEADLVGTEVKAYRALAARCNYLSTDRPDIQIAVKECCREMSKPTNKSMQRLTRVASYLKRHPRLVWNFDFQHWRRTQDVFGDANWAHCKRVRKSTSGGVAMFGGHTIKPWSKTQALTANSSAESELYGLVRTSCEALGLQALGEDLGHPLLSRVRIDAGAAKSIAEMTALDNTRHIDVNVLWLQDQAARDRLPLHNIFGTSNPADSMTKHFSSHQIEPYLKISHLEFPGGRAASAAELYPLIDSKSKPTKLSVRTPNSTSTPIIGESCNSKEDSGALINTVVQEYRWGAKGNCDSRGRQAESCKDEISVMTEHRTFLEKDEGAVEGAQVSPTDGVGEALKKGAGRATTAKSEDVGALSHVHARETTCLLHQDRDC